MEKDIELQDSKNLSNADEIDFSNADATKEAYQKALDVNKDISDSNRQLFSRAKKAEGFELRDDKWIKKEKEEKEEKPKVDKSEPDKEFGLLEKTYLRSADIVDDDEIELVKKLMEETGKDIEIIDTKYFKSELKELRDEKATTKATSDIKGGRGTSKATDTPEHWIAKGVPPTAEQVPDRKTRVSIARAMMAKEDSGKKFYND